VYTALAGLLLIVDAGPGLTPWATIFSPLRGSIWSLG